MLTEGFDLDAKCSSAMRNVLRFIHNATENAKIDVGLDFLGSRIQMRKRHNDRMTMRSVQAEYSPSDFKSYQLIKLGELFGLHYEGLAQDFERIGYSASRSSLEFEKLKATGEVRRNEWIDPRVITTAWPRSTAAHDPKVKLLVSDEMED